MSEYMDRVRELYLNPLSPLNAAERNTFGKVLRLKKELEHIYSKMFIDLENIEDFFGLVDMAIELGIKGRDVRDDLLFVIGRTLELTSVKHLDNPSVVAELREKGDLEELRTRVCRTDIGRLLTDLVCLVGEDDLVMTFNYDVVLEDALFVEEIAPDYGFADQGKEVLEYGKSGSRLLLKLHGSINWKTDGDGRVRALCHQKYRSVVSPSGHQSLGGSSTLVPPSWSKVAGLAVTKEIWTRAAKELSSAWQIVIVGYSLPVTDVFFKHLLGASLGRNEVLSAVIVVNPSEAVEQTYKQMFTRPMLEHGRLVILRWTLEDFVMHVRESPNPEDWTRLKQRSSRR